MAGVSVPPGEGDLTTAAGVVLGPVGLFAYLVYWYARADTGDGDRSRTAD